MRVRNFAVICIGLLLLAGCSGSERPTAENAGGHVSLDDRSSSPKPPAPPKPPPPRDIDCKQAKCVALTFDDGPGPYTARLLDTLHKAGARATFYMQGKNVSEFPKVVHRMAMEGHGLGNHTWNHKDLTTLSRAEARSQIKRTQKAVRDAAGVAPTTMRPPYGAVDSTAAAAVGMPLILWSVDPQDWLYRDVARAEERGVQKPGGGDVVLFHDIHKTTVEAMPKVVAGLQKRGFKLVTVPELFGRKNLKAGETYTELTVEATPVEADPPPAGSPAGPSARPSAGPDSPQVSPGQ